MDRTAMALNTPDAKWVYFCLATWQDPGLSEAEIAWARSFMETMRPWAAGAAPPNFMSPDDGAARLRGYYGEDKFRRLGAEGQVRPRQRLRAQPETLRRA
jgi:hypothetical protein